MEEFEVIEKFSKIIDYNSRSWNREKIDRYLLKYDDKRIIECMTIVHLKDEMPHDLTVEISNMYNCVVGCRFCAFGSLPESKVFLTAEDYVKQVKTCLKCSNESPTNYSKFYVAFTGIGEPSLVKEEIANGIKMLEKEYSNVQVNIATTGFDDTCFDYWDGMELPIRTLQLPYYSCNKDKIKYIIQNLPREYDLLKNIKRAIQYKNNHKICRVKVNFVVINNLNNTEDDVNEMISYLDKFKNDIIIKVSFLNYTKKCKENNLFSPNYEEMLKIMDKIKKAGFEAYLFGTKNNTELGCGQLVQNYISEDN